MSENNTCNTSHDPEETFRLALDDFINDVHKHHHQRFLRIAYSRLYDKRKTKDVVQQAYVKVLVWANKRQRVPNSVGFIYTGLGLCIREANRQPNNQEANTDLDFDDEGDTH